MFSNEWLRVSPRPSVLCMPSFKTKLFLLAPFAGLVKFQGFIVTGRPHAHTKARVFSAGAGNGLAAAGDYTLSTPASKGLDKEPLAVLLDASSRNRTVNFRFARVVGGQGSF